jgi:hypothetical protein
MATSERCPNHARHWFTEYGAPTFRLPRCVRCGAPNPNWPKQRPDMVLGHGEDAVREIEQAMEG